MDLNKLVLFVRVAEHLSFSGASAALGLPKSSVSRKVAELEESLNCRLLERSTRKLRLTEAGKKLYYDVSPLLDQLHEAEKEVILEQSIPRGKLCIVSNMEFGMFFLSKIVAEFMRLYPDIQIDFEMTNQRVDLLEKPVDIAFRVEPAPLPNSSLSSSWIANTPTGLFASPEFIKTNGQPHIPEALSQFPCLIFEGYATRWAFQRGAEVVQVDVQGPLRANSNSVIQKGIINGIGLGILPKPFSEKGRASGQLVELLPETPPLPARVYALTPHRKHRSLKVSRFLEFSRQKISDLLEHPI